MEDKNQTLQASLRCLQHPSSLISIALLLVNDHVLKILFPSWLTGKLSDFAGIFFFPFIVGALLSFILNKIKLSTHYVGQIAFGLVFIGFGSLKLIVPVNAFVGLAASKVYGSPVHYALDPTDVVALVALIPAWNLWINRDETKRTRAAYFALVFGALAAIASSPIAWEVYNVTDLAFSKDGVLYAADKASFGTVNYPIAKSLDGGLTWQEPDSTDSLPPTYHQTLPIQECYGETCYRISVNHQLEFRMSDQTWTAEFQSDSLSVKANDLLFIEWEGKEYLLVAIGKGGVLRHELPDGSWEIIRVIYAGPG